MQTIFKGVQLGCVCAGKPYLFGCGDGEQDAENIAATVKMKAGLKK